MSPVTPLTYGQGLEREVGEMASRPASHEHLKNLYLLDEGVAEVRKGVSLASSLTAPGTATITDVVAIIAVRGLRTAVVVGWASAERELHVFETDDVGGSPTHVPGPGTNSSWYVLPAGIPDPPVIIGAESAGRVFLAHDDPSPLRAYTAVYDPHEPVAGQKLYLLQADFRADDVNVGVRFRGVISYQEAYLFGWGWGDDQDGPHTLRFSQPGLPLDLFATSQAYDSIAASWWLVANFDPESYFNVGHRGDPIVSCALAGGPNEAGSVLLIFKRVGFHRLVGYSADNFGVKETDARYGLASSRLAITVAGSCFFWSPDGPRLSEGGPSLEIDLPLDLTGEDPVDLEAHGEDRLGFAYYLPYRRLISFVFGKREYTLHLRNLRNPRWTYTDRGVEMISAGSIYSGDVALDPALTGASINPNCVFESFTQINGVWSNVTHHGDEVTEVWRKDTDTPGSWIKFAEYPATGGVGVWLALGLATGTHYDFAVRMRRFGEYQTAYDDPDPANWPAASRVSCETTLNNPSGLSASPGSNSGEIDLSWTNGDPLNTADVAIERRTPPSSGTYAEVHVVTAPPGTTWTDTGLTGGTQYEYRIRHRKNGIVSDYSNESSATATV